MKPQVKLSQTNSKLVTAKQYKHFRNCVFTFNHTEQKRVFAQCYRKDLSVNKTPLRPTSLYPMLHIVSKHNSSCLRGADRLAIFYFMIKKTTIAAGELKKIHQKVVSFSFTATKVLA